MLIPRFHEFLRASSEYFPQSSSSSPHSSKHWWMAFANRNCSSCYKTHEPSTNRLRLVGNGLSKCTAQSANKSNNSSGNVNLFSLSSSPLCLQTPFNRDKGLNAKKGLTIANKSPHYDRKRTSLLVTTSTTSRSRKRYAAAGGGANPQRPTSAQIASPFIHECFAEQWTGPVTNGLQLTYERTKIALQQAWTVASSSYLLIGFQILRPHKPSQAWPIQGLCYQL